MRCSTSRSMDHHPRRSSTALLFAAVFFSGPNFRCTRTSARTLLCSSSKGNGAGAGANEGKQAHVIADAGIGRIERPGSQRRPRVPAPGRMMLARRGRAYGAIGVVVDRSVPQIIVRTSRAAHSVGSIDRMSGPMCERAWHVGAKAKLAVYVQKQRDKGGGKHRESNAGYAHFPQLVLFFFHIVARCRHWRQPRANREAKELAALPRPPGRGAGDSRRASLYGRRWRRE